MTCEHRIPDTAGGEHVCGRVAVALWTHQEYGTVLLCTRHDTKAIRANVAGWVRAAELPFPVTA